MSEPRGDYGPLDVRPIIRDQAVEFLRAEHRHNKRSLPGWKFGVGLYIAKQLVGVGIAGRPSSRVLDGQGAGHYIEVTRVGTTGVKNGCSKLYGALTRAAKALGYCRAYTYTLSHEGGASLRASGWTVDAELAPRSGWDCESRPRDEIDWPAEAKVRWIIHLDPACQLHSKVVGSEATREPSNGPLPVPSDPTYIGSSGDSDV